MPKENAIGCDGHELKVGDHVHICGTVKEVLENGKVVVTVDGHDHTVECPCDCCKHSHGK